jgi:NADH:ubiquinone oxidoreductase subunit 6 (subunit J)
MAEVLFFIAGVGAVAGALGVVMLRNPFYSVLALVFHLLSLAALFLLLRAEFVAAAQVVVYAGAVMVLYVFVVSYVGGGEEPITISGGPGLRIAAPLFAGALFVELCIATLGSGLKAIDSEGAPYAAGFGSPGEIGRLLLTDFLFPFELASYLLLVAAVGGVVLARRRRGLEGLPELAGLPAGSGVDEIVPRPETGAVAEVAAGPPTVGRARREGLPPAGLKGW